MTTRSIAAGLGAIVTAGLLLGASSSANAVVIDFSATPGGAFASYTESGVTFTAVGGGNLTSDNVTALTPNGTRGLIENGAVFEELRADIAGGTDMVGVDLGDFAGDSDLIFLEAFNAANMSIGFTSLDIGTFSGMTTLSLSVANIDHVIFGSRAPSINGSSVFADNFTFNATVPEPGTLALFGLGLAGLGFARRRKAA